MKNRDYPFSDGSPEDNSYFIEREAKRRVEDSAEDVVKKILEHLEQHRTVLEMDMRRFEDDGRSLRLTLAREKRNWIEGAILWIRHNV